MKDKYISAFLDMAERFGQTSTATRLKVGTLIIKNDSIISLGVNGMPPGWQTEICEDENNVTLAEVRHSEVAALEKLWNSHETASGATMVVSHSPCKPCSIKIATAGISSVYYRHAYRCDEGIKYLDSKGISVYKETENGFEKFESNSKIHSYSAIGACSCHCDDNISSSSYDGWSKRTQELLADHFHGDTNLPSK